MICRWLICLLACSSTLLAGSLSLGSYSGVPGGTVAANLMFASQGDAVSGIQFELDYDATILSINAIAGQAVTGAGKEVQVSPDRKKFLVAGLNQNLIADGVLVVLNIAVKDGSASGTYPVRFTSATSSDTRGTTKPMTSTSGVVQVGVARTPAISPGGVVQNFSGRPEIAPNTFISIYGSNFEGVGRKWDASDFQGQNLPAQLDGISATVNGKSAYVVYVGPTQVNVITPDDSFVGTADVQVRTRGGSSSPMKVAMSRQAPGLANFVVNGKTYLVATRGDGSVVGSAALSSSGVTFRPGRAGETVSLWGSGFGDCNPSAPSGVILSGDFPLKADVQVTVGGQAAIVSYKGMVSAGLAQVNVQLPQVAAGDQEILVRVDGATAVSNVFLTLQ